MKVGKWHLRQKYPSDLIEAACGSPKYYHAGITVDVTKVDCGMCKRTKEYKRTIGNYRKEWK